MERKEQINKAIEIEKNRKRRKKEKGAGGRAVKRMMK
jgi:hypothetical protein